MKPKRRKKPNAKTGQILVRVQPQTKELYETAAAAEGLLLSEWVRNVLDAAARRATR